MRNPPKTLLLTLLATCCLPGVALAAGDGVSPSPYKLFTVFGLPVTNSMVMSWGISLLLIVGLRLLVGKFSLIPSAGQAMVENVVVGLRDTFEPIVGHRTLPGALPLLLGLFVFIVIQNWAGLLPGVGVFGFTDAKGELKYWMRPGNADLNMTLAMALACMGAWLFICFKYAGPKLFFYEIFGNKADPKETPKPLYIALIPIFLGVGIIELISIAFRPVSLSFRLFGNIFGGENLLFGMADIFKWLLPIPFYFFELLVGVVQALIFTLLVAIYIGLVCNHDDH
ncbi:MAG: F0F1 ATP synthase subunit A [Opitutales bacterium]